MFLLSCKTFSPEKYIREGQPDECNDSYIVMGFYATVEKSDSAFIGTVYNECKVARDKNRKMEKEKHCKDLYYGKDKPIDKKDYEAYTLFLECQKQ